MCEPALKQNSIISVHRGTVIKTTPLVPTRSYLNVLYHFVYHRFRCEQD